MKPLYRDARGHRPGAYDFSPPGLWLMAAAIGSWLIVWSAWEFMQAAARAASGLI
ncbi:MAG: hypothetical protein P0Y65_05655 [Candidatus Devosia phytovorans]|uniref:Uncharacterized protein n=1 Tax=Candidatus Devosia phytovorans TaxID=3121372 RepID=A0AAJ5VWZ7_9HYPH|nr:hypothetical protein [Devosia sp.]WEK05740.1 MAG: hypothetical protein P0Y65_05655 [Devosia sp.]